MHAVRGFNRSHYYVLEEERLDTVFQLNVKGTTVFDYIIVTGIITAAADGTASKLQVYSFLVLNSLIQVTRTLRDWHPFALQTGQTFVCSLQMMRLLWNTMTGSYSHLPQTFLLISLTLRMWESLSEILQQSTSLTMIVKMLFLYL